MSDVVSLGLDADLRWLRAEVSQLEPGAGGSTVFVAGDEGSGQASLLQELVESLARERSAPPVISGTFERGRYMPRNHLGRQLARARRLVEGMVAVAEPLRSIADLLAQIVSQSKGAWQVGQELASGGGTDDPLTLLPQLLRKAVQTDGPLVCVIDDTDESSGWWADLMLTFSRQVAVELPLLLVFAVEGPERLGPAEDDDPPSLFVAKQLAEEGLAAWRPLRRVIAADLAEWIGPADRRVPAALCEVTGGRAGWTAEVWAEWRRTDAVVRGERGWRFSDSDREQVLAPLNHLLGRRLQARMGEDDLPLLARAQKVLVYGALEGRVFTADAVAKALAQDQDEVIDLLDDWLIGGESSPTRGLVEELPMISVVDETGTRHLRRYRFQAQLDLLVLRHYGFGGEETRRAGALTMAEALRSLYGAESRRVARSLAELFALAGKEDEARHFSQMHNVAADRATTLWQARYVLSNASGGSAAERDRAVRILLAAARLMYRSGPWDEGVRFTEAAAAMTRALSLRSSSLYYAAWFHARLEHRDTARRYLEEALAGFEGASGRDDIANANHQLANLDLAAGHYEAAEGRYRMVLEMRRARSDLAGQALAREALGDLYYAQDDLGRARAEFEAAIKLACRAERPLREAAAMFRMARLDYAEGRPERARAALQEILPVQRQHEDLHEQADALLLLSDLEFDEERFESALMALEEARRVRQRLGGPEAAALIRLGRICWKLDRPDDARAAHREALAIAERDRDLEALLPAHRELAGIEGTRENWPQARAHYEGALEIEEAIEDRAAQAETLHRMAEILYLEERLEEAVDTFLAALDLARKEEERERERNILFTLGDMAADDEQLDTAYDWLSASLAISHELGDEDEEATTESYLATIELRWDKRRRDDAPGPRARLERALALQTELGDSEGEAVTSNLLRQIQT